MKSTNWASPAENELADEAIRLGPGLAAARLRDDRVGLRTLFNSYSEKACELRVNDMQAWKIFAVSSLAWIVDLVVVVADTEDITHDAAATKMVARALEFTGA